jgi:hypothetical protein
MVHVEIIPENKDVMFTSYMFENFSMNKFNKYNPDHFKVLRVDLSYNEYDEMIKHLVDFVEKKIPYNYTDIIRLGTSMFLSDEDDYESVNDIKTIFCSQAATFILKSCLSETHPLTERIKFTNSRFTTPTELFHLMSPICQTVDNMYIK